MATRFTRVTVVAGGRSLDISLPAARPVLEFVPQMCELLSLAPEAAGRWKLSTVTGGGLDHRRSLDEAGIIDAETLYLTPPEQAPLPPLVDDVVDEVQTTLDGDGSEWRDTARMTGSAALAGVVVLILTYALTTMPVPVAVAPAALFTVAALAVLAGRVRGGPGGTLLIAATVPAWLVAGVLLARAIGWPESAWFTAGALGAGVGAALFALAGERWYGVAAGGLAVTVLGGLGTALLAAGLDPQQAAAVGSVVVVFAVGLAPQLALSSAGLVDLLRRQEESQWVGRQLVTAAVRRGQSVLSGVVVGVALAATAACVVLLTGPPGVGVVLGGVLGLVFALRSRVFTRTGQVLPMLVPPVTTATVAVLGGVRLTGADEMVTAWLTVAGALVVAAVVLWAGGSRLDDVGAARMRQLFDLAEVLAVVSLAPLVIAIFGGFDWAAG
ncbi:type VII secretion integral membrane protein EccD [Micromonospora sp. STR1_7]|uniref:Type VII secretion integral membrane protein EccD n=1 Tax=Micromonospora parastrephiae TaxID=2806101 RepID=A0ABS1XXK9_9ACTN|nr:type VII secretion integral membrane protein EccD [Micromonospora parastrephiae]MBM0233992.1 type VII secretion integral membrane protein EccD [Micromonospora parastrephiae]